MFKAIFVNVSVFVKIYNFKEQELNFEFLF